jgi:beta-lactamase class A
VVWQFRSRKTTDNRSEANLTRLDSRTRRRNREARKTEKNLSSSSLAIIPSPDSTLAKTVPPATTPVREREKTKKNLALPEYKTETPPRSTQKPTPETQERSPRRSPRRQRQRKEVDPEKLLLKIQRRRRFDQELELSGETAETLPKQKTPTTPSSLALSILRLLIAGIAIGAIAGTVLSKIDPTKKPLPETPKVEEKASVANTKKTNAPSPLTLGQPIQSLQDQVKTLFTQYSQLQPQLFFIDLDDNSYIDVNGATPIHAASTIKVPILIAFFQDLDAGKVRLDEMLTMTAETKAGQAGDMQYKPVGTKFSALETVTKMIVISDNTATNMIIARLGGKDALNQRFKQWGLKNTVINEFLPDLEGKNLTTPQDLTHVMIMISQGELVSLKSRDRLLDIMRQTKTKTLLPQGLGEGATISHKTGDIGIVLGDVGLIDVPNGKRYAGSVIVKRPFNDPKGRELIQQISRTVYDYFKQPPKNPTTATPQLSVISHQ